MNAGNMRRVLHVVHYPVFGGPHNQALRLAAPLRTRGWETIVLLPTESGNARDRLAEDGVQVVAIPLHRLRATRSLRTHLETVASLPREVRAIRRLIRAHRISVVQVSGLVNPHAAIAARSERVPVVWQLLDTRAPPLVAGAAMLLVRGLADAVMSTGSKVAASLPGGAAIAGRLFPYFPPVDTDLFRPRPEARDQVRSEWGIPRDASVVGCIANLNPQKGILDLVRAFARVRDRIDGVRLVIVGSEHRTHGAYTAEVRATIQRAGLAEGDDVILPGSRDDVERQLAGFDVFAFTPAPRGEGISTVVLEAMAVGLPVAAYDVAGLSEAIDDGQTGRLVALGGWQRMSDVIVELLASREVHSRMGAAARRHAIARFGLAACADVHVAAYRYALSRRGQAVE